MPSSNGITESVPLIPSDFSRAGLNTLHECTCPIARCTDRAAGGTNQRLQPAGATVRERARKPTAITARSALNT
jgi:hypothetical protein